jgi:hypothetical protein
MRQSGQGAQVAAYKTAYSRKMGRQQANFYAGPQKFGLTGQPGHHTQQSKKYAASDKRRQLHVTIGILNSVLYQIGNQCSSLQIKF